VSGWGAAAWSEEPGAAALQAAEWIQRVATARGWSADVRTAALVAVNRSSQAGASTPEGFFGALLAAWDSGAPAPLPAGWSKLGDVWAAAAGAARTTSEGRDAGSVVEIVKGTVAGAAGDVVASAQFARRWGPWIALLLVALAVGIWAWR
jgi:hypothetical protein